MSKKTELGKRYFPTFTKIVAGTPVNVCNCRKAAVEIEFIEFLLSKIKCKHVLGNNCYVKKICLD